MSVEFQDEQDLRPTFENNNQLIGGSKMANFLIKRGIAKDEKGATAILLGISVVSLILMVFVFYVFVLGNPLNKPKVDPNTAANAQIIKGFVDQGLKGPELSRKIMEARKNGLLK